MYTKVSYEVECEYCGKTFIAHDKRKRFCSKKCSDLSSKIKRGVRCNTSLEPFHKICSECGRPFDTYREATKTCSPECVKIRKRRLEKSRCRKRDSRSKYTLEEYKSIRKQNVEKKAIEKAWYKAIHTVERECIICGSLFYCLDKETRRTCSTECSKENKRRKRNFRTDNRINKNNLVDSDITLDKLYTRDNGICYLCGGICDKNDFTEKGNVRIYGKNYPSKEHVIPLALGGLHSWENVRLAHLGCNIDKGVTTPEYSKEMSIEHARKYASERCTNRKKTAQYSLSGELIKIWDSTAQINREMGLNDKHIQNVCRRHGSNTGNAYGYHWEYVS